MSRQTEIQDLLIDSINQIIGICVIPSLQQIDETFSLINSILNGISQMSLIDRFSRLIAQSMVEIDGAGFDEFGSLKIDVVFP